MQSRLAQADRALFRVIPNRVVLTSSAQVVLSLVISVQFEVQPQLIIISSIMAEFSDTGNFYLCVHGTTLHDVISQCTFCNAA